MNNLISVTFHNQTITAIEHHGQPYIAMQPLVKHLGLNWAEQIVLLNQLLPTSIEMLDVKAADGYPHCFLCIPLSKLCRYLYLIDTNQVAIALIPSLAAFKKQLQQKLAGERIGMGREIHALIKPLLVDQPGKVKSMIDQINQAEIKHQAA